MKVELLKNNSTDKIQVAYLEGVIMPNGEFIHKGKRFFLTDDSKVFVMHKD